jgi:hypothetical protein
MAYRCQFCGEEHDTLPMDIAFRRPEDYFKVPEPQRSRRIRESDDLCIIDDNVFLIRGILPIPVHDSEQDFVWGVWASVKRASFRRYQKLWNVDGSGEPPFRGRLSAKFPGYPDTYRLEVDAYMGKASERPIFRLLPTDHPLYHEQTDGITMMRVHEILRTALPKLFSNDA